MLHFILAFYILIFTLAAAVSIIAFLLAKKYNSILYIYAGLGFLGALLNLLADIICLYKTTAGNHPYSTHSLDYYMLVVASGFLMLYFIPLLVFRVTNHRFTKPMHALHILLLFIILSTLIYEYIHYTEIAKNISDILYAFIFTYSAIIIVLNRKRIKHRDVQTVLMSFSILILMIIPSIIIHRFVSLHFFPNNLFLNLPYFNALFLLTSAILALYYGTKYLFNNTALTNFGLPEDSIKKAGISEREEEIIELLIKGLSNAQIAEGLFISPKTVKNHIYHIYQKLGIKSRLQLMNKFLKDS